MADSAIRKLFEKDPITGNNIFHEIALEGSLTLLQRIKNTVNEPVHCYLQECNNYGITCLHLAASIPDQRRAIEVMEILRSLGADMNARALIGGHTVLHYAVYQKRYEVTKWLYELPEINAFIEDNAGDTPLSVAIKLKAYTLVSMIFELCRRNEVISEQEQDEVQ